MTRTGKAMSAYAERATTAHRRSRPLGSRAEDRRL